MKNFIGDKGFVTNGPVDGSDTLLIPSLAAPSGSLYSIVVDDTGVVTSILAPNATASYALTTAQWKDFGNEIATTSSVAIAGGLGAAYAAENIGSDVYFFVSGSPDKVSVFGGDVVISGTLASSSLRETKFIEFSPVLTPPVHSGAPDYPSAFLYTSGSDADLYIHHYDDYDNALNVRWLESNLCTGLLYGGVLSTEPGTTTFSISSGSGLFVKYNAAQNRNPRTTTNVLTWANIVSQSLNYPASEVTYVGFAENGNIIQQTTPFQNADYEQYLVLGRVITSGSTTVTARGFPQVSYGQSTWNAEFARAFGPLKISGHILSPSGSTSGLIKTGGASFIEGGNYAYDPNSPSYVPPSIDGNLIVSKLYRFAVSGSDAATSYYDYGVGNAGYPLLDTTRYNPNNNGVLTTVDPGKFTIQRVYWGPSAPTKALLVYYGPQQYATLADAQTALASEIFIEGLITTVSTIYVAAVIVCSGCLDLSDPTKALIIQGGLFRSSGIGAGGGAPSSTVVPGGIDTYVQFNDGGSTFGGNNGLTYNKGTKILTVNTLNATVNATLTKLTASVGIITPYISAGVGFYANGSGVVATGSFTGSFTGALVGTASYASNANLLDGFDSTAFPQLATANTFTQNNIFTTVTASAISSSGNIQVGGNLVVAGTSQLTGSAFFAGNVTLGDASTDIITATGRITASAGLSLTGSSTFAAGNTFTFNGNTVHAGGLSGSLQKLSDGTTPYLVGAGAITITTGANGSVTISGSATAEASGPWTPALFFEGVNGSHTYTAQLGTYYKIGRLVTANFIIALSSLDASTGNVNIVNLPFTSQTSTTGTGNGPIMVFKHINNGNKTTYISSFINSTTTTASLYYVRAAETASIRLTHAEFTNTTELTGSITYIAAT